MRTIVYDFNLTAKSISSKWRRNVHNEREFYIYKYV